MLVLGLESSCDETSIALLSNGTVITNRIYTQEIHSRFGGVVPEIASREHIKRIDRLCISVFEENKISPDNLDLIAVTDSPGLAGALLIGISFALGIHSGYKVPVIGINHIEGHIASVAIENEKLTFPFLALVVSGGHTAIYRVEDFGNYYILGQTIDDAAGEAFDKVGKMLGFPYPSGKVIETHASKHNSEKILSFPIARVSTPGFNFSFSGLKTALKYFLAKKDSAYINSHLPLICYSFQKAVITSIVKNITKAVEQSGIERIALVGGVACNNSLRSALLSLFGKKLFFPSPSLCTDNAAMIAKAGFENYNRGNYRFPFMDPVGSL